MTDYDYSVEVEDGLLEFEAYREGVNVYLRWSYGDNSGEKGGLDPDGFFVYDIHEYVKSGRSDKTELPEHLVKEIQEEVSSLRREALDELSEAELEALQTEELVVERARELLMHEGAPVISEYDEYVFEYSDGRGENHEVCVWVEARAGVAEVGVETDVVEGYSPSYDLKKNKLTLPSRQEWNIKLDIDVPPDIASELLDDLIELQTELNERREAYDDAVRRAREELGISDGSEA